MCVFHRLSLLPPTVLIPLHDCSHCQLLDIATKGDETERRGICCTTHTHSLAVASASPPSCPSFSVQRSNWPDWPRTDGAACLNFCDVSCRLLRNQRATCLLVLYYRLLCCVYQRKGGCRAWEKCWVRLFWTLQLSQLCVEDEPRRAGY